MRNLRKGRVVRRCRRGVKKIRIVERSDWMNELKRMTAVAMPAPWIQVEEIR